MDEALFATKATPSNTLNSIILSVCLWSSLLFSSGFHLVVHRCNSKHSDLMLTIFKPNVIPSRIGSMAAQARTCSLAVAGQIGSTVEKGATLSTGVVARMCSMGESMTTTSWLVPPTSWWPMTPTLSLGAKKSEQGASSRAISASTILLPADLERDTKSKRREQVSSSR